MRHVSSMGTRGQRRMQCRARATACPGPNVAFDRSLQPHLLPYDRFDKTTVFSNDFLHGEALLIFRQLSRILMFEKLVALCAGKCDENIKLLRGTMKVGYARVSTRDQHLALQLDALRKAGCRQVYEEIISGARA
ncbi:MAG TPA: recombinase family protein, partial [Candidatus Saccharimonadia bacterium]|nr:recombinase family protein [Candidatus Saccharimonadia bacterium]